MTLQGETCMNDNANNITFDLTNKLMQNSGDIILLLDNELRIIQFNIVAENFFNIREKNIMANNVLTIKDTPLLPLLKKV